MIEIKEISKIYYVDKQDIIALNNMSLTIKTGDFVAIVGPKGAGKSTLINILAGYYTPTTGKVIIDGESMNNLSNINMALYRFKNIGIIQHEFRDKSLGYILRNLRYRFFLAFSYKSKKRAGFEEVFKKLRLEELMIKKGKMNPEEKRRVAIGRAISYNPKIILADVTSESLYGSGSEKIMDILNEINKQGITIIMVAENPVEANRAKRVIKIIDGEIVSDIIKA